MATSQLSYLQYVRTVLFADERVSDSRKESLAEKIVEYARSHNVRNFSTIHALVDSWIDGGKFRSRTVAGRNSFTLEHPIGEDTEFGKLLSDDTVPSPLDILALREKKFIGGKELLEQLCDDNPDIRPVANILLSAERDTVVNREEVDSMGVVQSLRASLSRVQHGALLTPKKQVVSVSFTPEGVRFVYRRGYDDERVSKVLDGYFNGLSVLRIADVSGVTAETIYNWLYKQLGLPNVQKVQAERRRIEIVKRFDEGMEPEDIFPLLHCSWATVHRALRMNERNTGCIKAPFVYELSDDVRTVQDVLPILSGIGVHVPATYKSLFRFVRKFSDRHGRGPSRDEVYDSTGTDPWTYFQRLVDFGVLNKRELPRREYQRKSMKWG